MSFRNRRNSRRLPSAALAALALAGGMLPVAPASAAINTRHFQQTATISCVGGCAARFPALPASQAVDIDHIACEVVTDGQAAFLRFTLVPDSLNFLYPLAVDWQRKFIDSNVYTATEEVNIRIPFGRQARIDFLGGTTSGFCSLTGTKLIQS